MRCLLVVLPCGLLVSKILLAIEDKVTIYASIQTMDLLALVNECVMLIKLIKLKFNSVLPLGNTIGCIEGKGFSPVTQNPGAKLAHNDIPLRLHCCLMHLALELLLASGNLLQCLPSWSFEQIVFLCMCCAGHRIVLDHFDKRLACLGVVLPEHLLTLQDEPL
jgi:hypothetical protein